MSDEFDGKHLQEAFLQGNANAAYMGQQLADVVRGLLRLAVNGHSGTTALNASGSLQTMLELAARAPEGITYYDIIREAVKDLEPAEPHSATEHACLDLAEDGVRYFVELSSTDGFSAARARKRLDDLRHGARELDESIRVRREAKERARAGQGRATKTIAKLASE